MNLKYTITILAVAAVMIAVAFGAVAYQSASAAAPTPVAPTTDDGTTDSAPVPGFRAGGPGNGGLMQGGAEDEYLAAALGISVDELTAAFEQAQAAALAQAVEQGLITQAQADEISANGPGFGGGHRGGWLGESGIDFDALLAEALGISVEELQAARLQAFNARIEQAVADGDITQEQADLVQGQRALHADSAFQASMQSAFEAAVSQAVDSGVITQAQADQILANQASQPGFFGGGPGGPGGGHGGPGGPGGPVGPGGPGQP